MIVPLMCTMSILLRSLHIWGPSLLTYGGSFVFLLEINQMGYHMFQMCFYMAVKLFTLISQLYSQLGYMFQKYIYVSVMLFTLIYQLYS